MTYCLGRKTENCVYLVADTATTSRRRLRTHRSSFGEQHVSGVTENVEEGALKIISAGRAGITFSGCATLGYATAETFRMGVAAGLRPRLALERAISSTLSSNDEFDLSVLCAFVDGREPHLLSFNRDGDRRFVEHALRDVVQLGSLVGKKGNLVCQISDAFIGELQKTDLEGAALLACALGLCQSYGIHNVLLELGVGGAFVGAFVNESTFRWQPNIAYMLFGPGEGALSERFMVFPFVHDDVLVVSSLVADGPPRIIINSLGEPSETALKRAHNADRQCLAALSKLQFDYLTFLNTTAPIVTVIEMARRSEHRDVISHPLPSPTAEGKGVVPMSIGPNLYALIDAGSNLVDAQRHGRDSSLDVTLHYVNFHQPCFDVRHVDFQAGFFGVEEEGPGLPDDTRARYEAARDTAPIFIQIRDHVGFGAAHLLKSYLDNQGKALEDYIPRQERKPEGSVFRMSFSINFANGSFYMSTVDGRRDIREFKLVVEITWLAIRHLTSTCRRFSWTPE